MIRPCGYRVLVKADPIEERSAGGIYVLASELEAKLEKAGQELGTIVAIGPLAWKAHLKGSHGEHIGTPWAKVGDKVQYSRYGGKFIKDPTTQEEYVLLADEDISAVFENE